ncbi:MAG TPA: 3-deoxy-8-phosphooctulonate synthase, partial [Leptospiraceae bacterium]|nr:3-deoxy-8-phosphooctulonate synthase [Leptospiraceae bacterium]
AGKVKECGSDKVIITERGTSFGYNNLVFDLRSIPILHSMDIPVIFDGTHSAQLPGGAGNITGGQREFIPDMMRGAVSAGIEGLFMEVHPDPPSAKSDSTTQYYLSETKKLLSDLLKLDRLVKKEILS